MDLFLGGQALPKWSKHVKIWIPAWWFHLFMVAPTGTTYIFLGRLHPKMNRSGPSRSSQKRHKPASAIFWHSFSHFSRVFRRLVVCDVGHSFATEANPQVPGQTTCLNVMGKYRHLSVLIGKVMTKQWILGYLGVNRSYHIGHSQI